jgi:hypothetical protein
VIIERPELRFGAFGIDLLFVLCQFIGFDFFRGHSNGGAHFGKTFVAEHKSNQFVFVTIFMDFSIPMFAPVDLIEIFSLCYLSQTVATVGFVKGFGSFVEVTIAKAKGIGAPEQKTTQGILVEFAFFIQFENALLNMV